MNRTLMTTRLLEFETQSFSLSHSLSRGSSSLDPQVVLLLQKAAPACYHIRNRLARVLEGGQETIFNEICDLVTQTQTRIQYKMPPPSTATIHSRVRVLVVGVLFGCAVVYHYRARIRRVSGRITRWGLQARRFLGRRRRRGATPENVFLPRNEAAARQPHSTSPMTKIPNLSTYCRTPPPATSPPATRNRPYPNVKGSPIASTPIRPVSNTPLCRMQFCEWASRSC